MLNVYFFRVDYGGGRSTVKAIIASSLEGAHRRASREGSMHARAFAIPRPDCVTDAEMRQYRDVCAFWSAHPVILANIHALDEGKGIDAMRDPWAQSA